MNQQKSGPPTAIIVGVGEGLGWSLVRRFTASGMKVAMAARNDEKLHELLSASRRRMPGPMCATWPSEARSKHCGRRSGVTSARRTS